MLLKNRNYTLDFIRGFSALLVMSGHLRIAIFKDYNQLNETPNLLIKIFYFITGLGHQAVMIFFVLSGYFVGGSIIKNINKFNFKKYLIARVSRLWTPLIPILLLTLIIDSITGLISSNILNGDYYEILNSGPKNNYSLSFITFFANLCFLQTIYSPVYGTNGPLWSLANEFWYYVIFPLSLISIGFIKKKLIIKILLSILLVFIVIFITKQIMEGFLIWLMGVAVYLTVNKKIQKNNSLFFTITFGIFLFSLIDSKFSILGPNFKDFSDIFVGISFSLLLVFLVKIKLPFSKVFNLNKISFYLSEISYTLYISHFPIILLIYVTFYKKNQLVVNNTNFIIFIIWLLGLILISYLLWNLFEKHTPKIRKKLENILK
jgi:peptidoglycan/LPS O-acetylase OafA/YrhL